MNLSVRATSEEELDHPSTKFLDYRKVMEELAVINRVTLTHRAVLAWLASQGREKFSLIDVGCGGGDLLRAIQRRYPQARLVGIDSNPRAATVAREQQLMQETDTPIHYRTGNVFHTPRSIKADYIVSSQVAHHLDDDEVVKLLQWMDDRSYIGWHLTDLHRNAFALYAFQFIGGAIGLHHITVDDGVISISRGFRRREWKEFIERAQVDANIVWHPLFRYSISRIK
jgi:2-polyprenyl-3-methyl-5-hydroxy-6-metoxy-1,4-benzoquinol methylase